MIWLYLAEGKIRKCLGHFWEFMEIVAPPFERNSSSQILFKLTRWTNPIFSSKLYMIVHFFLMPAPTISRIGWKVVKIQNQSFKSKKRRECCELISTEAWLYQHCTPHWLNIFFDSQSSLTRNRAAETHVVWMTFENSHLCWWWRQYL